MLRLLRSILAVVAGLVVAGLLTFGIEWIGHQVFPPPEGFNSDDPEKVRAAFAEVGTGAFIWVLAAWFVGTLMGAWTAGRASRRAPRIHGLIVGLLLLGAAIFQMASLPHPIWFWIFGILAILLAAHWGSSVAKRQFVARRRRRAG